MYLYFFFFSLLQPYNTTRISRSLLSARIKELNQASNQEDKNGKKGFLEEFEVCVLKLKIFFIKTYIISFVYRLSKIIAIGSARI